MVGYGYGFSTLEGEEKELFPIWCQSEVYSDFKANVCYIIKLSKKMNQFGMVNGSVGENILCKFKDLSFSFTIQVKSQMW